eukprot:scaffold463_cov341-Pavlova_lutheri.AAC.3
MEMKVFSRQNIIPALDHGQQAWNPPVIQSDWSRSVRTPRRWRVTALGTRGRTRGGSWLGDQGPVESRSGPLECIHCHIQGSGDVQQSQLQRPNRREGVQTNTNQQGRDGSFDTSDGLKTQRRLSAYGRQTQLVDLGHDCRSRLITGDVRQGARDVFHLLPPSQRGDGAVSRRRGWGQRRGKRCRVHQEDGRPDSFRERSHHLHERDHQLEQYV